jgi:hypothetical protein
MVSFLISEVGGVRITENPRSNVSHDRLEFRKTMDDEKRPSHAPPNPVVVSDTRSVGPVRGRGGDVGFQQRGPGMVPM